MADPAMTDVDVEVVPPAAARLVVLAEALAEAWAAARTQIQTIEESRCWGGDEPGTAFEQSYLGTGETSYPQVTSENATALIDRLHEIGMSLLASAALSDLTDQDSAGTLHGLPDAPR
jgi:hypothetical protein